MIAITPRPKLDIVQPGVPGYDGGSWHRMSRCAGVVVLAVLPSVGSRHATSIVPLSRRATISDSSGILRTPGTEAEIDRLAAADRVEEAGRESWFRIGDLLNAMRRQDHLDRTKDDALEPQPERVGTPFELKLPSLSPRDSGR